MIIFETHTKLTIHATKIGDLYPDKHFIHGL